MKIIDVQNNLIELGFGSYLRPYGADNKDGDRTRSGVKAFQRAYNGKFKDRKNLVIDGIAGIRTKKAFEHWFKNIGQVGSRFFRIDEFRCKGTGKMHKNGMDNKLIRKLERLRYILGDRAIIVTSGYRTPAHNKKVGGVSNSQHLYGRASDIKVIGVSATKVYNESVKLFDGVGKYSTFTHVDTRGWKARF